MIHKIKKTFQLIFTKTDLFFKMALFDLLFVVSLFFTNSFFLLLLPENPSFLIQIVSSFKFVLLFVVLVLFLYFSCILLIYSFFKYLNLDLLGGIKVKKDFSFHSFFAFYKLNLLLFGMITLLFGILNVILSLIVNETFAMIFSVVTFFPFALLSISSVSIAHVLFLKEKDIKKIILKAYLQILTLKHLSVYGIAVIFFLMYVLFYYGTALLFGISALTNASHLFVNVFAGITLFVFYFIFTFCRAYLFLEGE